MVADKAFVFLLHSPMPLLELSQEQFDRLEGKVDEGNRLLRTLIKALGEELEEQATTLDGIPAGQERDSTQSLG